jgi:hypothetical protein
MFDVGCVSVGIANVPMGAAHRHANSTITNDPMGTGHRHAGPTIINIPVDTAHRHICAAG